MGREDPLGQGMATHTSIHASRIPWTEDPGGLQSSGSQSWTRLKRLSTHSRLLSTLLFSIPGASTRAVTQEKETNAIKITVGEANCT